MGSILGALDVNNFWQLLDKMAKQVPLEDPWNAPCALEWDKMTVKQLIDQKCWTRQNLQQNIAWSTPLYKNLNIFSSLFGYTVVKRKKKIFQINKLIFNKYIAAEKHQLTDTHPVILPVTLNSQDLNINSPHQLLNISL